MAVSGTGCPKPKACAVAEESRGMVGGEAGPESGARFADDAYSALERLASAAVVGMRSGAEELAARRSTCHSSFAIREEPEIGHPQRGWNRGRAFKFDTD